MNDSRLAVAVLTILLAVQAGPAHAEPELTDVTTWADAPDRHWVGSAIWANRLQDWRVVDGVLTCAESYGGWHWRTAHLTTHGLAERGDAFRVELDLERGPAGSAGLLIAGGEGAIHHQKASLIQGQPGTNGGFLVAWDFAAGGLNVFDFGTQEGSVALEPLPGQRVATPVPADAPARATLVVAGRRADDGERFDLTAQLVADGRVIAETTAPAPAARLVGNVAIASLNAQQPRPHRFHALRVGGDRVAHHPERAFGPIAGVLYSVANGDLKVGVQCVSLGQTLTPRSRQQRDSRLAVRLEEHQTDGTWKPMSNATGVSEPDYYALLRVTGYDASALRRFRVVLNGKSDLDASYEFSVPAEPDGALVVGSVSCTGVMGRRSDQPELTGDGTRFVGRWSDANVWAPWEGVTGPLLQREPDIVFFTGDQLYEYNPTARDPADAFPTDDYLYKWLIWHRAFRDVTRQVPTVMQTDDHDVWHPNLWGDGGRLMTEGGDWGGGFLMSTYFVNLVQRTMCGHNPDAYDPGPLDSGVTNYFTAFTYGNVDFAVLEDRKFKSAGADETRQTDGLVLLGDSQLRMLEQWADAEDAAPARVVVSQTNYAKVSTDDPNAGVIGTQRDTDGWPKPARDRAVALFERAGAVLFTGDQHLASVVRLETPAGPGVVQFSQPAGGCIWWRSFFPAAEQHTGDGPRPGQAPYLGRFADGHGNAYHVLAVANPGPIDAVTRHPNPQNHRLTPEEFAHGIGNTTRVHAGEGFAVLLVQPEADRLTLECWPLDADPTAGPAAQFPDWPIELELSTLRPADP